MAKFDKKCKPEIVTQKLENIKNISSEGNATFNGFEFEIYSEILSRMINIGDDIPEIEKRRITTEAIFIAGKSGTLTPKTIIGEVQRLKNAYIAKRPIRYQLITSISLSTDIEVSTIRYNDVLIKFCKELQSKAHSARGDLLSSAKDSIYGDIPRDYMFVVASLMSRTPYEAVQKALSSLNFVRGVWNYGLNKAQSMRWGGNKRKPINRVVLGPIHTVHHGNGDAASQTWWFEPEYNGPVTALGPQILVDSMLKFYRLAVRRIAKCKYESELVGSIERYSCALDLTDYNASFVRLWSELELLTSTRNERYEVTIKRACKLWKDKEFALQELEMLRQYRNRFVHEGKDSSHVEALLYRLKRYVEVLLRFHIARTGTFSSLSEFGEFLDMPDDLQKINSIIRNCKMAKRFVES